jgi:hypothetical protein
MFTQMDNELIHLPTTLLWLLTHPYRAILLLLLSLGLLQLLTDSLKKLLKTLLTQLLHLPLYLIRILISNPPSAEHNQNTKAERSRSPVTAHSQAPVTAHSQAPVTAHSQAPVAERSRSHLPEILTRLETLHQEQIQLLTELKHTLAQSHQPALVPQTPPTPFHPPATPSPPVASATAPIATTQPEQ